MIVSRCQACPGPRIVDLAHRSRQRGRHRRGGDCPDVPVDHRRGENIVAESVALQAQPFDDHVDPSPNIVRIINPGHGCIQAHHVTPHNSAELIISCGQRRQSRRIVDLAHRSRQRRRHRRWGDRSDVPIDHR